MSDLAAGDPWSIDRERLGRAVREAWVEWAKEQPMSKPSWLVPWEGLSEDDREADRRIGDHLVGFIRREIATYLDESGRFAERDRAPLLRHRETPEPSAPQGTER